MSTEYKDWYNDLSQNQKVNYNICMEYPFLIPEDENYDYDYLSLEIPDGWRKLFFQMCGDIKPLLEKEGLMDKFRFIQVKEKFGEMVCYTNEYSNKEIEDIIIKYHYISSRICSHCGKPANYTTIGYILPFCSGCWKEHIPVEQVDFKPEFRIFKYNKNKDSYKKVTVSCKEEWERYVKSNFS